MWVRWSISTGSRSIPRRVRARRPPRGRQEDLEDVAAVVRVGRGSGGDRSTEIAGDDQVGVGAADALLWSLAEGIDPAWAHRAVPAGHTECAISALWLLGGEPVPRPPPARRPRRAPPPSRAADRRPRRHWDRRR